MPDIMEMSKVCIKLIVKTRWTLRIELYLFSKGGVVEIIY